MTIKHSLEILHVPNLTRHFEKIDLSFYDYVINIITFLRLGSTRQNDKSLAKLSNISILHSKSHCQS